MRLSICIPTYSRCDHVLGTLDAVAPQVSGEVEVVISDNGSQDRTAETVRRWIASHPTLEARLLTRESNVGLDRNLLDVVAAARGDYCWLLGDDDIPRPTAVRSILSALEASPTVPHLLLNHARRDARTGRIDKPTMVCLTEDWGPSTASEFFFRPCPSPSYFRLLGTNIITISANVVHRESWGAQAAACLPFMGLNMIHVFVITAMLQSHGSGVFLAVPQVEYTCNNDFRSWPNDVWHDYRTHVYGHLAALGYDRHRLASAVQESIAHRTWREFLKAMVVPRPGKA